ncbi:MAG: alpha/beta hydrolase family protein [Erythrobacter sp.]
MQQIFRYVAGVALVVGLPLGHGSAIAQQAAAPAPAPAAAAPVETLPPSIPASQFAARPAFWDAKLSPNGVMMAFMRYKDGNPIFVISDTVSGKLAGAVALEPSDDFEWYRWVGDGKLLLSVSTPGDFFGDEVRYTRLFLFEVSTGALTRLFSRSTVVENDNVIHVAKDGSYILVAIQQTPYDYPAVQRHDLAPNGKITTVQQPREGVWNWDADDQGVVRMGTGFVDGKLKVYYRATAGGPLALVARLQDDDREGLWDTLQIVNGSDEGYVLSEGENGRVALRRFNFAKREVIETVYEHPDLDVESAVLREGKPFAAFYTSDRDEVHWFDPEMARHDRGLRKALGAGEVWMVSRSENNARMLVYAGGESDPGVLYLYDPAAKLLREVSQYRPGLDYRSLAKPKPVRYTARDGTPIRGYLTLPRGREAKALPLIVMPHGGPFGVRDKLEYNDEVQLLANRGYAVLQPNYRGSGGYGNAFFALGNGQIGRKMQDDLDDAMDWAVAEGIADPKRVCVVGGSYGGYAALWAVLRNPERYRCAASWAGVTDWTKLLKYDRGYLSKRVNKVWSAKVRGDGTADLDTVSPYRAAEQLSRPVLLAHGTKDQRVPMSQYNVFEKAARTAPIPPQTLVI